MENLVRLSDDLVRDKITLDDYRARLSSAVQMRGTVSDQDLLRLADIIVMYWRT